MRVRILFQKTDAMRYTGHLDLHKAWERVFRRAGLPLAYSQGFHPQPRLNLAAALPLGFTSQVEILDAWLEQELPAGEIQAALEEALPPGIQIGKLEEVDNSLPALQTQVQSAEYQVQLLDPVSGLEARISTLLANERLPRSRRGKEYDLRPLVEEVRALAGNEQGLQQVYMRLLAQDGATGRPEEVLDAMGIAPEAARVHRIGIVMKPAD